MIYLDTSVLVAYYYPEPLSEIAQDIVQSQTRPVVTADKVMAAAATHLGLETRFLSE